MSTTHAIAVMAAEFAQEFKAAGVAVPWAVCEAAATAHVIEGQESAAGVFAAAGIKLEKRAERWMSGTGFVSFKVNGKTLMCA